MSRQEPTRRTLLCGALAVGGTTVLPGTLVGCARSGPVSDSSDAAASIAAGASIPADQVPVGTVVLITANGAPVAIAQPEPGTYVALSGICTHQGARLMTQEGLVLYCPAHHSEFDAADHGAVIAKPATRPLPEIAVRLDGDELILG